MRGVTQTDLMAAARVLLLAPPPSRYAVARAMIAQANAADTYRQKNRCLHPYFGNGTLLSVALPRPNAAPKRPGDPEYLSCMALMIDVILESYSQPTR